MSYILDALRKSETERTQDATPNLLTAQHMRGRPRTALLLTLIAVLAVNAAVIGAWLWRPGAHSAAPAAQHPVRQGPAPVHAEPLAPAQAVVTLPPEARPERAAAPNDRVEPSDAVEPSDVVVPAEDADAGTAIEVSSHVYSTDPHARAITIAGRRYQEGDSIKAGVRLVEITETGIVVEDHGQRRVVDVLNGWH
jgi:general secretion pathway protein B